MDLEAILTEMEDLIYNSSRVLWSGKIIMDSDELARIMDSLREAIPKEVQKANNLLEDQKNIRDAARSEADSIIAQANADAKEIIEQAREDANKMISSEEVVKQANAESEEILEEANNRAEVIRVSSEEYSQQLIDESKKFAGEVFDYLEKNLGDTLYSIQEQRNNFLEEKEALEEKENEE